MARNRALLATHNAAGRFENFSAANFLRLRRTRSLISRYAQGQVLDAGCGHMLFKQDLLHKAESYQGLDIDPKVPEGTVKGDIQNMVDFDTNNFDTVCCFEVLEHVPLPSQAMCEFARVLKPHGVLLMTVPHLSRLHEVPHDYYRYTEFGIAELCKRAGLEVVHIVPYGGISAFIAHQISTAVLCLVWGVPLLRQLAYLINSVLLVWPLNLMEDMFKSHRLCPLGYCIVARKKTVQTSR